MIVLFIITNIFTILVTSVEHSMLPPPPLKKNKKQKLVARCNCTPCFPLAMPLFWMKHVHTSKEMNKKKIELGWLVPNSLEMEVRHNDGKIRLLPLHIKGSLLAGRTILICKELRILYL